MKRILIALLVAAGLFGTQLQAGNLVPLGVAQGKGAAVKDASTGINVEQVADRGILWSTATAGTVATVLSATSQAVTMTGASASYAGFYYISVYNSGTGDMILTPRTSLTPINSASPVWRVAAGTVSGPLGPISRRSTHVHFLGQTTTATAGSFVLGYSE